jgi:hypothetical protein
LENNKSKIVYIFLTLIVDSFVSFLEFITSKNSSNIVFLTGCWRKYKLNEGFNFYSFESPLIILDASKYIDNS